MSCKLQVVNCAEWADIKTMFKIISMNIGFCERLQLSLSTIDRRHPSFGWSLNIHTKTQLAVTTNDNVERRPKHVYIKQLCLRLLTNWCYLKNSRRSANGPICVLGLLLGYLYHNIMVSQLTYKIMLWPVQCMQAVYVPLCVHRVPMSHIGLHSGALICCWHHKYCLL